MDLGVKIFFVISIIWLVLFILAAYGEYRARQKIFWSLIARVLDED